MQWADSLSRGDANNDGGGGGPPSRRITFIVFSFSAESALGHTAASQQIMNLENRDNSNRPTGRHTYIALAEKKALKKRGGFDRTPPKQTPERVIPPMCVIEAPKKCGLAFLFLFPMTGREGEAVAAFFFRRPPSPSTPYNSNKWPSHRIRRRMLQTGIVSLRYDGPEPRFCFAQQRVLQTVPPVHCTSTHASSLPPAALTSSHSPLLSLYF